MNILLWPWNYGLRMMEEGDPDPSWPVIIKVVLFLAIVGFTITVIIARRYPEDRMFTLGMGLGITFFGLIVHPMAFLVVTILIPLVAIFGLGCLFVYGLPHRAPKPPKPPLPDRIAQLEQELDIGD